MKKVANILFLVAAILSIVLTVTYGILGIMFFVFGAPQYKEIIVKGLEEGTINSSIPGSPEEIATALQATFIGLGVMFVIMAVLAGVNIFFSFKGRNSDSKGVFIANIVLGFLSSIIVNLVAGIFGLIKENTIVE